MGFGSSQSQYWPCWDRRLRHRSPWPTTNSIENSLSPNICHCFLQLAPLYSWRIKLKREKREERERKGGEKSRPKHDRTRQSISRWSNKSKDRLLTTVFKSTEKKKRNESLSRIYHATLPLWIFDISCSTRENYSSSLDIPYHRMNELGVTNCLTTRHVHGEFVS